jgi:N-acyl-D-amino-acid deacylase
MALVSCATPEPQYDLIIRNGLVIDGSGSPGIATAVAIRGDRIAAVGALTNATARQTLDATGLVVAPGFINMLSWADEPLLVDGRSQSEIKQGVTLEVFGEGWSMGPLTEHMKTEQLAAQGDLKFAIDWTSTLRGWSARESRPMLRPLSAPRRYASTRSGTTTASQPRKNSRA